jgi:hypothetical protein
MFKVLGSGFADRAEGSEFRVPAFASKASVFVKTSPGQVVAESWFWIADFLYRSSLPSSLSYIYSSLSSYAISSSSSFLLSSSSFSYSSANTYQEFLSITCFSRGRRTRGGVRDCRHASIRPRRRTRPRQYGDIVNVDFRSSGFRCQDLVLARLKIY